MKRLILFLSVFLLFTCSYGQGIIRANVNARAVVSGDNPVPSYDNEGGTGDRRSIITVSVSSSYFQQEDTPHLVDGSLTDANNEFDWVAVSGKYIRFDFGSGKSKLITEAKFYQETNVDQSVYNWQGSNNATDWTNIGNNFNLGGATTQTITELSGNTNGYRYYQLLGVSGMTNSNPYIYEFEFKIDDK
jgi:hypothetical protein